MSRYQGIFVKNDDLYTHNCQFSYSHSIVAPVHVVVPLAISSTSCHLVLNRPNQIRIKG